jgi:hypothetical protein
MTDRPRLHCASSFFFFPASPLDSRRRLSPHWQHKNLGTLLDLNRRLRGGDTSEQVCLFFLAFGADGEGIEDAQR